MHTGDLPPITVFLLQCGGDGIAEPPPPPILPLDLSPSPPALRPAPRW